MSYEGKFPFSRRGFLRLCAGTAVVASVGSAFRPPAASNGIIASQLVMPSLPFSDDALAPHISASTVRLHYHEHHAAYHRVLESYLRGHPRFGSLGLEQLLGADGERLGFPDEMKTIAVLFWNHNLYWQCLRPGGGAIPRGRKEFAGAVRRRYESLDGLKTEIVKVAQTIGIGWVWLVRAGTDLDVVWTDYQFYPVSEDYRPLLVIDVWEHAYYLDYYNDRPRYVKALLDHCIDWGRAARRFEDA